MSVNVLKFTHEFQEKNDWIYRDKQTANLEVGEDKHIDVDEIES